MPATYQVCIDGKLLTSAATWGELETIHGWPGDCLEMSWSMTTRYKAHAPIFHRDAVVTANIAGYPVWGGLLQEPEWNGRDAQVTARGWYRVGENYPALTADLVATNNPHHVIVDQQARGLPWRMTAGTIPDIAFPDDDDEIGNRSVAGLMDSWAEWFGAWHWGVDPTRRVYFAQDAAAVAGAQPHYHVPAGSGELSDSDEGFASHVVLAYANTSGGYSRVMYPPPGSPVTPYERQWGHNDFRRDITDLGPVDDATAAIIAQSVYERAKLRPAWTSGLELLPGELRTRGGVAADFTRVRGNQIVRVHGVRDVIAQTPYIDFTIGKVTRKQGEKSISIDPVGVVASTPEDIYQKLLEEAWAAAGRPRVLA